MDKILRFMLVTDSRVRGAHLLQTVIDAVRGGVTIVQYRAPDLSFSEQVTEASMLVDALRPLKVPLIINDYVDVCLEVHADGVHLGQNDMPVAEARRQLPEKIIGLSIGSVAEFEASQASIPLITYAGVGPVYGTTTKTDAGKAIGINGLESVVSRLSIPCLAIGGIGANNAFACLESGAVGVAVVSRVMLSNHPYEAALEISDILSAYDPS